MSRRFQFSLKALLQAMLVVAIGVWGYLQAKRSMHFWSLAKHAPEQADGNRAAARIYANLADTGWETRPDGKRRKLSNDDVTWSREGEADCLTIASYYDKLYGKYRKATLSPWSSVEDDEPPPKHRYYEQQP